MFDNLLIYFILPILPGLIWLLYFLKKDVNPEPKKTIIAVFILGFIISIPVAFFSLWFLNDLDSLKNDLPYKIFLAIRYIFVIGLIEELFKYLAVRYSVLKSSQIDEPIDIPLYMIISALGFATAENLVIFCTQSLNMENALLLTTARFIMGTILHALCSGIIGYFLAIAYYRLKFRYYFIFFGFSLAIIIHAFFNFFLESSIIKETTGEWGSSTLYSLLIVIVFFFLLSLGLKRLKKLKSVCKI